MLSVVHPIQSDRWQEDELAVAQIDLRKVFAGGFGESCVRCNQVELESPVEQVHFRLYEKTPGPLVSHFEGIFQGVWTCSASMKEQQVLWRDGPRPSVPCDRSAVRTFYYS